MIYILRDKDIMRRCVQYISTLGGGAPMMVEIKPYKRGRSTAQNRYYFGVVLKILGDYTGETPEDLHDYFKFRLLSGKEKIICGEMIPGTASTARLTTAEFSEYVDKIRAAAAQMGCVIPDPYEYGLDERARA